MRAGVLTEPITFIKAEINKNDYGQEETVWNDYIKTRSQVKYKSGNRVTENNEIINTYTVEFIVRRYHKIDEFMRILWKNRKYRILAINEDKQSITITGELINE
ncbi:putative phage head-tail adaptor [Parabacteroides sp. CAG:409]|nr:putative phage head-tail adaptor [Parabacteroides sp. CAG:409]